MKPPPLPREANRAIGEHLISRGKGIKDRKMVGFLGALLLTPLRNAAVLPAMILGGTAVGAAFGSFDLSRRAVSLLVPLPGPGKERHGTFSFASGLSFSTSMAIVAAREAMFSPVVVPPPVYPSGSNVPLFTQISNGFKVMAHTVRHYPIRFRFATAFVAGVAGGVSWPLYVSYFNSKGGRDTVEVSRAEGGDNSSGEGR